jgi:peptidoglycan LD-endopeptidase LytH
MRRIFLIFPGFLLTACAMQITPAVPTVLIPLPIHVTSVPAPTFSPAILTALFPTATKASGTPFNPPAETATGVTTETSVSYLYIFPIQPSGAAGFAEGTSSHGYPATDIFAQIGTKFVAVTSGVVDFVSNEDLWDPAHDDPALRGGISVAIIGDDGLRYYGSHLSKIAPGIAPGIRVTAGQLIGFVGNSGDARTTMAHLHFGISRPTYSNDWKTRRGQLDPFPFLLAWRAGYRVTPPLSALPTESPTEIGTPKSSLSNTLTRTPNLYPYVFPIQPPNLAGFSDGGHSFPATDIFAPLGTKFVAVTNGTVELVTALDSWDPNHPNRSTAGGLSVRILGDDGVLYYGAHLSAIASGIMPGVWVPVGQLLGLVGKSGDARYTAPHVHFEISFPVSSSPLVDPFQFLLAWRDGVEITPSLPTP